MSDPPEEADRALGFQETDMSGFGETVREHRGAFQLPARGACMMLGEFSLLQSRVLSCFLGQSVQRKRSIHSVSVGAVLMTSRSSSSRLTPASLNSSIRRQIGGCIERQVEAGMHL